MEGWIKIHRKMLDWKWASTPATLCTFVHLLLLASYEERAWKNEMLHPGQLITSVASLCKETGLTTKQVRNALSNLQKTEEIVVKGASKYSIITICKYEDYQVCEGSEGQTKGKQRANKGQTKGNILRNKEVKNSKEENINKRRKFVEPTLDEVQEYCQSRNNGVDAMHFISYYQSCGWMVGRNHMKDWKAAIRTWERNNRNNNSMGLDSRRGTDAPKRPNYEQGL